MIIKKVLRFSTYSILLVVFQLVGIAHLSAAHISSNLQFASRYRSTDKLKKELPVYVTGMFNVDNLGYLNTLHLNFEVNYDFMRPKEYDTSYKDYMSFLSFINKDKKNNEDQRYIFFLNEFYLQSQYYFHNKLTMYAGRQLISEGFDLFLIDGGRVEYHLLPQVIIEGYSGNALYD
ncbi:MAG: hypothetical protein WCG27_03335, partial [Pseudomonadota bacterium]